MFTIHVWDCLLGSKCKQYLGFCNNMLHYGLLTIVGLLSVPCLLIVPGQCSKDLPEFAEAIPNVTVAVGREATLQCTIDNLGSYKVAWIKLDTETLLSYHIHVITRENRIKVTNSNHRQWSLHIKELNVTDRGFYMCQINTEPMISQLGYLDVTVPPTISEEDTSTDTVVDERSRVSLRCRASGYPTPTISWKREDKKDINIGPLGNHNSSVPRVEGEYLNLTQVTREDMAPYLCIASNGVPPSVSKRILLQINFQPKIRVVSQMVPAVIGSDAILGCRIEASPRPLTSWVRNDGAILITNKQYELHEEEDLYRMSMQLKIKDLTERDFGPYKCVAKNILGEKEGFVRLIEATPPTSVTQSTPVYDVFIPVHKVVTEHQAMKNDSGMSKKGYGVPEPNSFRDESRHLSSEKQMSPAHSPSLLETEDNQRRANQIPTQKSQTPSKSSHSTTIEALPMLISVLLFYELKPNLLL